MSPAPQDLTRRRAFALVRDRAAGIRRRVMDASRQCSPASPCEEALLGCIKELVALIEDVARLAEGEPC